MFFLTELTLALCIVSFGFTFFCFYLYAKNKIIYVDRKNIVKVTTLVDYFGKLCPLGQKNQWTLLPYGCGLPQCWYRIYPLKILNKDIHIYGSASLITSQSLVVFNMIANTCQWANYIRKVKDQLIMKPIENNLFQKGVSMQAAEIINRFNKVDSYRFSYFNKNKLGWILFWSAQKVQMLFILIQPVESFETDQCLLTYVFGSYSKFNQRSLAHKLLYNVNSIKNSSEMSSIYALPFECGSILKNKSSFIYPKKLTDESVSNFYHKNNETNCSISDQLKHINQLKALSLVPYIQTSIFFLRKFKKFELLQNSSNLFEDDKNISEYKERKKVNFPAKSRIRLNNSSNSNSSKSIEKQLNLYQSLPTYDSSTLIKHNKDFTLKRSNTISSAQDMGKNISYSVKARSTSDLHLITKETLSSIKEKPLLENNENSKEFSEIYEDCEDICNPSMRTCTDGSNLQIEELRDPADFEILLPNFEGSDEQIAGLKTKGNYYASKLQAEILEAESIDLSSPIEEQSGGWAFHSCVKGITMLSKQSFSGQLKVISYICDTEIPLKCVDVWKLIKNPRSRFICDDSVKKVDILEELSSDQKIVYVYHEATNILRKECIDFCLLHTERQEQSKYYLSLCSLEFMNCPLMDGMTRGTLLPSGFVVEPCSEEDGNTKVKYLFSIIVSNPSSQFLYDLSYTLPYYMYNLKTYLLTKP